MLQELSRLSVEANQLRMAVEEARTAAEDSRRGRLALQVTWLMFASYLTLPACLACACPGIAMRCKLSLHQQWHVSLRPALFLLMCVQSQLDEATSSIQQLQAALSRTATGAAGVCYLRVVTALHVVCFPLYLVPETLDNTQG